MNLILLVTLLALLILILRSKDNKEYFGEVCKEFGWSIFKKDVCFNMPTMPSADSIFDDIKEKIKNKVLNPAVDPIKKTANKVKDAGEAIGKNFVGFVNMLKNIRIE